MKSLALLLFALAVVTAPKLSIAQTRAIDSLRRDVNELRQTQAAILREIRELRRQLNPPQHAQDVATAGPRPTIDITGPALGSPTARVTVVEFSDYECPFCRRFFDASFHALSDDYIRTGRVRYVIKDFPIEGLHPHAFKAAEATHCAGEQGKYWEMHDALFANQSALQRPQLATYAAQVGADSAAFGYCLDHSHQAAPVRRGLSEGQRAGVNGTPAFFIAITQPGDTVAQPLYVVRGAKTYPEFRRLIDAALAAADAR